MTQTGAADGIQVASAQFTLLDRAGAAWSALPGDHDVPGDGDGDDQRVRTSYLDEFGPKRFRQSPSYRGASPDGSALLDDRGPGLWGPSVSQHDQTFLTLNGRCCRPGPTSMRNGAGHDVDLHLVDFQDRCYDGGAMTRPYHVDLERNAIDVETLSPIILGSGLGTGDELADEEAALSGDVDRFTVSVDFEQRCAGSAPVPARAARRTAQMLMPGTVAYWCLDEYADSVPADRSVPRCARAPPYAVTLRSRGRRRPRGS